MVNNCTNCGDGECYECTDVLIINNYDGLASAVSARFQITAWEVQAHVAHLLVSEMGLSYGEFCFSDVEDRIRNVLLNEEYTVTPVERTHHIVKCCGRSSEIAP